MPAKRPSSRSAGAFLALAVIAGALIGTLGGQPSLGVVLGAAIGVAICVALWLVDRRA